MITYQLFSFVPEGMLGVFVEVELETVSRGLFVRAVNIQRSGRESGKPEYPVQ
jgi:hypothetical protein